MKEKKISSRNVKKVFLYIILIVSAIPMVVPFLWMISTSLKSTQYTLSIPIRLIPDKVTLDSYKTLFETISFGKMYMNSIFVAVVTTLGQLLISAMAAYAFARIKFRGSNVLFLLYLATMMIPSQVIVTPLFILMRYLGWLDSYQGLIVPSLFKAFGVFLMRQTFMTLPKELEEAAYIDGANHFVIFWRIILPLSKPVLVTQGLMAFMDSWNAYLWPLFVVSKKEMFTLPIGLANLHGQYLTEWNVVMAGTVLSIIPMLCIYIFAQKQLVKGFVTSGLKG